MVEYNPKSKYENPLSTEEFFEDVFFALSSRNILKLIKPLLKAVKGYEPEKVTNLFVSPYEAVEMLKTKGCVVLTDDEEVAQKADTMGISIFVGYASQISRVQAKYKLDINSGDLDTTLPSSLEKAISLYQQSCQQPAKPTVLIVEDEPNYLKLCKDTFEDEGFKVKTAKNVDEAILRIQERGIDVIVTDLKLDYASSGGFHVLQTVIAEKLNIPIILHTCSGSNPTVVSTAKKAGMYDVLKKETGSEIKLLDIVKGLLEPKGQSMSPLSDGTIDQYAGELDAEKRIRIFREELEKTRH